MDHTGTAGSALTAHIRAAIAAVQLRGQQIILLGLVTGRGLFVFGQPFLHLVKQILRHDGRDAARRHDVPEAKLSDVAAIAQEVLHGVVADLVSPCGSDALFIQPVPDLCQGRAFVVLLKRFQHKRSSIRIKLEMLIVVDHIAQRHCAAVVFGLERVFCHAAHNLLGKIGGIVFRVTLQNRFEDDTLCTVGNHFGGRDNLDAILFELSFVPCAVIAIPGKTIQLPNNDHIEQTLPAVPDHVLKLRAVVRLCGEGSINIMPQNCDPVLFRVGRALPELTLDGFLPLTVGGVSSIDHSGHFCSSFIIRFSVSFSFAPTAEPGSKHISMNLSISGLQRSRCGSAEKYIP